MAKDPRIFNVTRQFHLKRNQALRAIEECACAWAVEGESIRDLTLAESIAKRNEQAANREPLPHVELPGITYQPPTTGQAAQREGYALIMQANALCGV
jgi:hypothetical protein